MIQHGLCLTVRGNAPSTPPDVVARQLSRTLHARAVSNTALGAQRRSERGTFDESAAALVDPVSGGIKGIYWGRMVAGSCRYSSMSAVSCTTDGPDQYQHAVDGLGGLLVNGVKALTNGASAVARLSRPGRSQVLRGRDGDR